MNSPEHSGDVERAGLLRRGGSSLSSQGRILRDRSSSTHLPGADVALMRSRSDIAEMVAFQEGDPEPDPDEASQDGSDVESEKKKFEPKKILGLDQRPFYPAALVFSVVWSMALTSSQAEVAQVLFGRGWHFSIFFITIYTVTGATMAYTGLWNPGIMNDDMYRQYMNDKRTAPERSSKHWLYKRPVLRFHQYCRWVTNVIGLNNHREYIIMLFGLLIMGSCDACLDVIHVVVNLFQIERLDTMSLWLSECVLLLHFAYSAYLAYYTSTLVRMHVNFIIRNEMTLEWQRDEFYVIYDSATGEKIAVADLDDDEFDANFNNFIYDPSRNKWDKGWRRNCFSFWFTPRYFPAHHAPWGPKGEF